MFLGWGLQVRSLSVDTRSTKCPRIHTATNADKHTEIKQQCGVVKNSRIYWSNISALETLGLQFGKIDAGACNFYRLNSWVSSVQWGLMPEQSSQIISLKFGVKYRWQANCAITCRFCFNAADPGQLKVNREPIDRLTVWHDAFWILTVNGNNRELDQRRTGPEMDWFSWTGHKYLIRTMVKNQPNMNGKDSQ